MADVTSGSAGRTPTYMFVYGTLKQGEANFGRWMAPFMQRRVGEGEGEEQTAVTTTDATINATPASCSCTMRFTGPALTVHRYPFCIYDYPCVYNAPFDTIVPEAPKNDEDADKMNAVGDSFAPVVYHAEPQRVLGEVYEIIPCPLHSAAEGYTQINACRVVERLDVLEDVTSGMYSRVNTQAEVAVVASGSSTDDLEEGTQQKKKKKKNIVVTAQIYFRTNVFPRDELVKMVAAGAAANGVTTTAEAINALIPPLLSEDDGLGCIAEGRVAAPTLKGFLRTYRGGDHHKIVGE